LGFGREPDNPSSLKIIVRPETLKDVLDENRKQKTIWLKGTACSMDPRNRMLEEMS